MTPMHFVYIVRCNDGTLYTGYARDPQKREKTHNDGKGAKYTSGRRPVRLVYSEACETQSAALTREHQLQDLASGLLIARRKQLTCRGPHQVGWRDALRVAAVRSELLIQGSELSRHSKFQGNQGVFLSGMCLGG